MIYRNGFQSLSIDSGFVKDLVLYDERLYLWQEEDGHYYISYDPYMYPRTLERARMQIALSVPLREDGSIREPDTRDLLQLMQNDQKHTSIDSIFGRVRASQEAYRSNKRYEYRQHVSESAEKIAYLTSKLP